MKKILCLSVLFLLAGCIGGGFSQQSSFYELICLNPASSLSAQNVAVTVGVSETVLPGYLDRPQIVTVEDNLVGRHISEVNRWAEPLTSLIQRTLACDIGGSLPGVFVKPGSFSERFDYTVSVDINRFDARFDKDVSLDAWWQISKGETVLLREHTVLSLPLGDDYPDLVRTQSRLIADLADKISLRLADLIKKK